MPQSRRQLHARAFVLGPAYHGATLLALLLNNHSRVTALGDTLPFHAHPDYWCSCGKRIEACEFWQSLRRELDVERFDGPKWLPVAPAFDADPQANRLAVRKRVQQPERWQEKWFPPREARDFVAATLKMHQVACALQGTDVVVDGEKNRYRYLALRRYSRRRLRVIHLTRDPRGYVLSYQKNLDEAEGVDRIAREWALYHRDVIDRCAKLHPGDYVRIRYEDICESGDAALAPVFESLGLAPESVCRPPQPPHHVIGNRMLAEFNGTITADRRYEEALTPQQQRLILDLAGDVAAELGYGAPGPRNTRSSAS